MLFSKNCSRIVCYWMSYRVLDEVAEHCVLVHALCITKEVAVELSVARCFNKTFEYQNIENITLFKLIINDWLLVSQKQRCQSFQKCFSNLINGFSRKSAVLNPCYFWISLLFVCRNIFVLRVSVVWARVRRYINWFFRSLVIIWSKLFSKYFDSLFIVFVFQLSDLVY